MVGEHVTPECVDRLVRAYLCWLPEGTVVLGGDTRSSHDALVKLVMAICQLCGRDVIYIGMVPTPTVQQMVRRHRAAGGFAITASHNPVEWNGIKWIDASGSFLDQRAFESFYEGYTSGQGAPFVSWDQQGRSITDDTALSYHIDAIISALPALSGPPKKVLIDVNHGTGSVASRQLCDRLGVSMTALFDGLPGHFSHNPEPTANHLSALCDQMATGEYDIGFAQDPDADRLVIVDETGRFIGEDYSLAFCMDGYFNALSVSNPVAVVNLSTSLIIRWLIESYGGTLHETKIGEANVTEMMKRIGADIGGEGNGGVIVPCVGWGRDSLVGMMLALLHIGQTNQSVSQLVSAYPTYHMVREKQPISSQQDVSVILDRMADYYRNDTVNRDDGIKVTFESSWVHVRPSNTEPILRIFAEAPTKEAAWALVRDAQQVADKATRHGAG